MVTICKRCNHRIEGTAKYLSCKKCQMFTANVDYNKPLAIELKNLIVKYNIPQKEFKFSADGVITNLLKDEKVQNAMKEGLVQGIQNVGKKKTDTKNNENAYALKERIRLAEMQNSMLKIEGNKMETKTKIIIGVGVTVVVIVATILIMKSMKNKNATGGQLGSNANAGAGAVANPPLAK